MPREAYVPETYRANGSDEELKQKYSKSDMKSEFINLIGRIKDPEGEVPSTIIACGLTIDEVKKFVEQKEVPQPYVLPVLVQPATPEKFYLTHRLFWQTPRERWINIQEDLPLLVQIIIKCKEKGKVRGGKVIEGQTERVQRVAKEYSDILENYNIKIKPSKRGISLLYSKS